MQTAQDISNEHVLAAAAYSGDRHAITEIYTRYHDMLCADASNYIGQEDAEDVVQDVFTSLCINYHRLSTPHTLRQYLFASVRNRARDLVVRRRHEHRIRHTPDYDLQGILPGPPTMPDTELLTQELEHVITHFLSQSGVQGARVVSLAPRLTYAEIGAELGITCATVHTLLTRGRRALRKRLCTAGWHEVRRAPARISKARA